MKSKQALLIAILAVTLSGLRPSVSWSESAFNHVHNRVPKGQQEAAAEWYREVFGGAPGERGPGADFPNGFLGAMPNDGPAGDGSVSVIDHIGVYVPDVAAAVARVRDTGGEVYEEPRTHPAGFQLARIRDPWGARYELMEFPDREGIDHVHLFLSDAEAACEWFREVFGGERDPNRSQAGFLAIRYGGFWVHCTQLAEDEYREPSQGRVTDHFALSVPSLDMFCESLGSIESEPRRKCPDSSSDDVISIDGPEGIHLEIAEQVQDP